MKKLSNRKSIFYILIIRIFISIFIFRAIQTAFYINDEITIQNKRTENQTVVITDEIEAILSFIRINLTSVGKYYAISQSQILNDLGQVLSHSNAQNKDLKKALIKINEDTLKYDLIIIKDSTIINSTNKKEINTNFINRIAIANRPFFRELIEKEDIDFSYIKFDKEKLKFKAYNYIKLKNGNIVELSSYSQVFDNVINYLKTRIEVIDKTYNNINSLDFWFHTKTDALPLLKTSKKIIKNFIDKQSFVLDTTLQDNKLRIEHYYQETNSISNEFSGVSLSIVYNIDMQDKIIYELIKRRIINTLLYFIILVIIIFFATRSLKITLADILKKTATISSGNLKERVTVKGNNEFTTLAEQFNKMVEQLEFVFSDIRQKNEEITAQRDEIEKKKNEETKQRELIENQKQNIIDSIYYAKYIQKATLPNTNYIDKILPNNLIFFKPRDIVSGDFYWINKVGNNLIIAAADCTGHGIPGAFMSMLGITLLNDIVQKKKIIQPNLILNELRNLVKSSLKQNESNNKDGMDIALCSINIVQKTFEYAGAYNPLIIIRDNKIIEYPADRMPVGIHFKEKDSFTNNQINIQKDDKFYIYSDRYADQLGGKRRTKLLSKNFKNLLLEISNYPYKKQEELLKKKLQEWMGNNEQTDDIIIISFKI